MKRKFTPGMFVKIPLFYCSCGLLLLLISHVNCFAQLAPIDPGRYDTTWWNRTPIRLIQTNLREIDAMMDKDAFVNSIEAASANVVIINVGGIVANYPTRLPFHYPNPYMKGDLTGDLVERLHAKGIKVLGRFDVSKINESLAAKKPEWLYVGTDGKNVNYNGQVHTCVNGGYQQQYTFEILKEVIANYDLDGIFFNMPGYTTTDYSGIYHGICQCANCKKRFHDSTGMVLPVKEDLNDPVYRRYNAFRKSTSEKLFTQIGSFIKKQNPNLIISTYTDAGVDMTRSESSSWLTSEYEWNYFSTDHVKRVLGSYKDRVPSNLLQYFLAIGYRHIATSPNISRIWVLENMLNGAPLDVYVIGTLVNQEDRRFIPVMNDIYRFHKTNEQLFTNLQPVSNVALIRGSTEEYRGMIKLLTEEHIMFDVIEPQAAGSARLPRKLDEYDALILGDVSDMDDAFILLIDNYVKNGGKILVTGFTSTNDGMGTARNRIGLESLGVMPRYSLFHQAKSTYLKISGNDKTVLGKKEFEDVDLMMMYGDFLECRTNSKSTGYLKLLPATRFGPPEKSYYDDSEITTFPGIISNIFGKGKSVYIPWAIGAQYHFKGHYAHKKLFTAALKNMLNIEPSIITNASPLIEMTRMANRNGAFEWIGMLNHSGQIGASILEPVEIHNTTIRFKPLKPVKEIRLMRAGESIDFKQKDGWLECTVPAINDFELLCCLYN
ncbi:MAG: Beta-galactosidase [Ferruginibacter sp.]|nr:Beta-galactosidase [Ferruginibacter sp.]